MALLYEASMAKPVDAGNLVAGWSKATVETTMFYETEELERYIEEHGLRAVWERSRAEISRSENQSREMTTFINGALAAINAIQYLLEEKLEDGDEAAYGSTLRLILRLKIQAGEMIAAARI